MQNLNAHLLPLTVRRSLSLPFASFDEQLLFRCVLTETLVIDELYSSWRTEMIALLPFVVQTF